MNPQLHLPKVSVEAPAAMDITVRVNGQPVFVHDTMVAVFAQFAFEGAPVQVEVNAPSFEGVKIRPLSRGIMPTVDGNVVRFSLDTPAKLSIEFDDRLRRPLFLFADEPVKDQPDPNDRNVRFFASGRVYDAGVIELSAGQSLFIEQGAVVRGCVKAADATNIRIFGQGILDGRMFKPQEANMIRLLRCPHARIEGITIINSQTWTTVPIACDDLTIRNIKQISGANSDDGIDVVGCQRVVIDDVFIRTKDDCIVIKATAAGRCDDAGMRDVCDVTVTRGVFWNAEWGNALEIGYELRAESVENISFVDCDVIHCEREGWSSGGVLTIHNGDRATVSNIRYENIRVEDAREKLIDFKVQHSRYSKDQTRGQIRNVIVKDVAIVDGSLPPSIIQSFNAEHGVDGVTIENLTVNARPVKSLLEAGVIAEMTRNVRIT